jgi:predicted DCC family thiol-disulfide oxidoreductase YuxK
LVLTRIKGRRGQPPGAAHAAPAFYFARGPLRRDGAALHAMTSSPFTSHAGPVLFFDGDCGLCQRLVRLLLRLDPAGRLRFAPLQGPTAQAYLRVHGLPTEDFDTLVFVPDWNRRAQPEFLLRTAGVIAALRSINRPGARALAAAIAIFPGGLRDAVYRVIGHWRYRIFGPWKPRPLPRAEWVERFLA